MIDSASVLRSLLADVAGGLVPVTTLDDEMALLSEQLPAFEHQPLGRLVGEVDLLLAELTSGDLTVDEFLGELRGIGQVRVEQGAPSTGYVLRTITTALPGVAELHAEGLTPSPVFGTGRAAVLA